MIVTLTICHRELRKGNYKRSKRLSIKKMRNNNEQKIYADESENILEHILGPYNNFLIYIVV